MRDLEFNVNGKSYLKMLKVSNKSGDFQIASSKDPRDFEPKFFKICENEDGVQYEEVDPEILKELKEIYSPKQKEKNI